MPLPDDVHCPTCQKWKRDHPAVVATMKARKIPPMETWFCKCPPDGAPVVDERATQLLRYANLPEHPDGPKTLENFTPRRGTEDAQAVSREYAEGEASFRVLVLIGQAGTGKSHLLEAIARSWLARRQVVKYEYVPQLLEHFRHAYDDEAGMAFLDVYDRYQAADLLVLDDLGAEVVTKWVAEKVTTLLDERYRNGRYLAIGTNLTREDVAEAYHERLASRLWDVSSGTVRTVYLRATDYRALGDGRRRQP